MKTVANLASTVQVIKILEIRGDRSITIHFLGHSMSKYDIGNEVKVNDRTRIVLQV